MLHELLNYCGYGVTFWTAEYGDACTQHPDSCHYSKHNPLNQKGVGIW